MYGVRVAAKVSFNFNFALKPSHEFVIMGMSGMC